MDIIVDIQAMRDKDHGFLPKEVCVVALDHPFMAHWIVAPPYSFSDLPPSTRSENKYLTLNHHGLEWYEGDVNCRQLHANLREIAKHSRNIWTRGREKANLLCQIMTREINDLEHAQWGCPSFNYLPATCTRCLRHSLGGVSPFTRCAMAQANRMKKFIRKISFHSDRPLDEPEEEEEEEIEKKEILGEDTCDGCEMCKK